MKYEFAILAQPCTFSAFSEEFNPQTGMKCTYFHFQENLCVGARCP